MWCSERPLHCLQYVCALCLSLVALNLSQTDQTWNHYEVFVLTLYLEWHPTAAHSFFYTNAMHPLVALTSRTVSEIILVYIFSLSILTQQSNGCATIWNISTTNYHMFCDVVTI